MSSSPYKIFPWFIFFFDFLVFSSTENHHGSIQCFPSSQYHFEQ
jgi:hypothetical protein